MMLVAILDYKGHFRARRRDAAVARNSDDPSACAGGGDQGHLVAAVKVREAVRQRFRELQLCSMKAQLDGVRGEAPVKELQPVPIVCPDGPNVDALRLIGGVAP